MGRLEKDSNIELAFLSMYISIYFAVASTIFFHGRCVEPTLSTLLSQGVIIVAVQIITFLILIKITKK